MFSGGQFLRHGIINLDKMPQRIPLGWTTKLNATDVAGQWINSLALEATLQREPDMATKAPRLKNLIESREHPYLSMIPSEKFHVVQASTILCNSTRIAPDFVNLCSAVRAPANEVNYLRGRILVVGETGELIDKHRIGSVVSKSTHICRAGARRWSRRGDFGFTCVGRTPFGLLRRAG
jgi:hypothetical protein